jgi:hypothetical protein
MAIETEAERLLKQEKADLEAIIASRRTLSDIQAARLAQIEREIQMQQDVAKALDDQVAFATRLEAAAVSRLTAAQATGDQEKINKARLEASQANLEKLKAEYERIKKDSTASVGAIDAMRQAVIDATIETRNLNDQISEANENLKEQTQLQDALTGGLVSQAKKYFTIQGQLENIKGIFDSVMKGNVEYAKTTGQVADRTMMFGLGASQFGIGFEEMNKSAMSLFTTMSGFSDLNKGMQKDLAESSAKLELLGISSETSGKNLDILTKTFKMTASEALRANEELAQAAIGAGIAPQKMAAGFAEAMPKLAAYGKQALQIYTDLQKQAKSLGLEVSNLTSIVGETMDTFEGSAKAAGKFNAVLGGGYLNSIELLNANEAQRVILLKRAFEQSGKNFDSLGKYEKKAIAATLGIQNMDDATKLFSKSTSELEMEQAKNAASQEKLEEVQRAAAESTKQMSQAFNGLLIVIAPIAKMVKNIMDVFSAFFSLGDGWVGVALSVTAAIFGLSKAFKALNLSTGRSIAIMALIAAIQLLHYWLLEPHSPILYFALLALPVMIFAIGQAADANEKPLLALGAAVAMIGAGVYMAASGLAELVKSFQGLGDAAPYAAAAVGIFSLAFFGMVAMLISLVAGPQAVLTGAAIGVLLAVGGAIALIGAGVGIAAAGLGSLVTSFGVFSGDKGASIAENISATTGALVMMITTLTGVGAVGLLAIGGITVAVAALVEELNKIPEGKVLSLETLDNTLKTVKTLKDSDLEPTRKFVTVVKDYYTEQAKSKDADKDAFVVALKEVMGEFNKGAAGTTAEGGSIPIKLVIADGKEFAASIVESAGSPRLATALGGRTLSRRT